LSFPIDLTIGLYGSLYYRTSRDIRLTFLLALHSNYFAAVRALPDKQFTSDPLPTRLLKPGTHYPCPRAVDTGVKK